MKTCQITHYARLQSTMDLTQVTDVPIVSHTIPIHTQSLRYFAESSQNRHSGGGGGGGNTYMGEGIDLT